MIPKEYGDWREVSINDFDEDVYEEVKAAQQEQINELVKEIGAKKYIIDWIAPKVIMSWKITVYEDDRPVEVQA